MPHQLIVKPSVVKSIRKLDRDAQRRVIQLLEALTHTPRPAGVTKLAGDDNLWRVRMGDYRVVYEIYDERLVILVVRVAHRKDVYRKD